MDKRFTKDRLATVTTKFTISTLLGLIVVAIIAGGVTAAALGGGFTDQVRISTGDVEQLPSDVEIDNIAYAGPGNNVDSVVLSLTNTNENSEITADITVWVLDGDRVLTEGTVLGETIDAAASEHTVVVDLDDRINRNQYTDVNVLLEEQ